MVYDLIGDIHGHAQELDNLLEELGYRRHGELYEPPHQERRVIFLGDFLDRGPEIREIVRTVQAMVKAGVAMTVMGNHEYNAVAFHTPDGKGGWLRNRSNPHLFQHIETLYQYRGRPKEFKELLDWCRALPFYLDLPELRVAHAAWIPEDISFLKEIERPGRPLLDEEFLKRSSVEGTRENEVVEHLLKGVELDLPEGIHFIDKEGFRRTRSRIAWWLEPRQTPPRTLGEVAFPPSTTESGHRLAEEESQLLRGYDRKKPLFLGHYWLSGTPEPLTSHIACLDYSVAAGGTLVAYTFRGEETLRREHFTVVPSRS